MKDKLGILLTGFILVLVGVILTSTISDSVEEATEINIVTNDSITITSGTGTTTNDDLSSVSFFGNSTNSTHLAAVTITEEVNWTSAGVITVSTLHFPADGTYNITYQYENDNYVTNSTARTLIGLLTLFFALGVLAVGILVARKGLQDYL